MLHRAAVPERPVQSLRPADHLLSLRPAGHLLPLRPAGHLLPLRPADHLLPLGPARPLRLSSNYTPAPRTKEESAGVTL